MPLADLPRIFGGKRREKKSAPLHMADAPSRGQLIDWGHYYRSKKARHTLSGRGVKLHRELPVCVRRYYEFMGLSASDKEYVDPPGLVTPNPRVVYEIQGVASFTDTREAMISAKVLHKQVLLTKR